MQTEELKKRGCKLFQLLLVYYWVESMMSSVISFAYFTLVFSKTQTSLELLQIFANSKQHFYSFMEFNTSKKSRGKKLIIVSLKLILLS